MKPQSGFKHEGVVSKRLGDIVEIEVGVIAACEGCKAKQSCAKGKGEDKRLMSVETADAWRYTVGDRVGVSIAYGVGFMAVALMYMAPLVVLILSLVALIAVGMNEGVAALLSIAIVGGYYTILYKNRDRFERKVEFKLTKLEC